MRLSERVALVSGERAKGSLESGVRRFRSVRTLLLMRILSQAPVVRTPHVSRMCLWNADKHVWRALHLGRDQVRHLNVIRQRYPAVIQGQWMNDVDTLAINAPDAGPQKPIGTPSPSGQGMRAGPAVQSGGNPIGTGTRMEHIGLQAELREVLSDEQLRRWEELCNGVK